MLSQVNSPSSFLCSDLISCSASNLSVPLVRHALVSWPSPAPSSRLDLSRAVGLQQREWVREMQDSCSIKLPRAAALGVWTSALVVLVLGLEHTLQRFGALEHKPDCQIALVAQK